MQVVNASGTPTLELDSGPPENSCRPAVDVLFRSVANVYGEGVLAIVLTGMGSDGTRGCELVRSRGGYVIAQDHATSVVWGMPGSVVRANLAHQVVALDDVVPTALRRMAMRVGTRSMLKLGA
jgi:two-component system chemotaxis response regulator CheB